MIKKLLEPARRSLIVRMILSQLFALAVAALVFFAVSGSGRYAVAHSYMSP